MKNEIKIFNEYVKTFDLKVKDIMKKYHHSFRVMDICEAIANDLGLSDNDVYLARLCGLLHDIARFKQWTQFKTYKDIDSFDHGDYGYKILKENDFIKQFVQDEKEISIVLDSVKYHNKLIVPILNEKNMLFSNIVRDADKLDIMSTQGNQIKDNEIRLNEKMLNSIYNKEICKNKDVTTEIDHIIRMLSWVFDFNFKYSYKYLIENKIIEQKFNLLEIYGETEEIKKLKQFINERIRSFA